MKRKQKKLTIRKTGNLTNKMRKERGCEEFETTSSAISMSSERSDSVRAEKKRDSRPCAVKIQKEKTIIYDADLASTCERTCDTRSMNSIVEVEDLADFEKKCQESSVVGPQLVPIKYVTTHAETPICAVFVSDFDLCEAMANPKVPMPQAKRTEATKRFEMELRFLEEVASDVEKLITACGRMDVELKIVKTRDDNGMPRGRISLIRRMKAEKPGENLMKQPGLYGFEAEDAELPNPERGFVGIAKPTELRSNIISSMFSAVKQRFGFQ